MNKNTIKYFFELGTLKRQKRTGWWLAGVKNPESVAEHSWRTAVIAYFLAAEEGLDPEKACSRALFHDVLEARLGDLHKVNTNYLKTTKELEKRIELAQCKKLGKTGDRVLDLLNDEKFRVVCKDADYLELCVQAKEYEDVGFKATRDWLNRAGSRLKTKTAKKMLSEIKKTDSTVWWKGLKQKVSEYK
ncbi:MAG: HD domain-containing protein [Candidatus Micrarchaeota archaeon]